MLQSLCYNNIICRRGCRGDELCLKFTKRGIIMKVSLTFKKTNLCYWSLQFEIVQAGNFKIKTDFHGNHRSLYTLHDDILRLFFTLSPGTKEIEVILSDEELPNSYKMLLLPDRNMFSSSSLIIETSKQYELFGGFSPEFEEDVIRKLTKGKKPLWFTIEEYYRE